MELKLSGDEVRRIIIEWANREMPCKFNTAHFKGYGNEVELTFVEPETSDSPEGGNKKTNE